MGKKHDQRMRYAMTRAPDSRTGGRVRALGEPGSALVGWAVQYTRDVPFPTARVYGTFEIVGDALRVLGSTTEVARDGQVSITSELSPGATRPPHVP